MANEFKIKNGLIVSGSVEIEQNLTVNGTLIIDELSGDIDYSSIINAPTLVSGSSQIAITGTTGYSTFSSSIATTDLNQNDRLSNIEGVTGSYATTSSVNNISSSINTRIDLITNTQATTGSNNFVGTQTITGSLYVSQDLIVQGSSSLQDITGSNVYIGTNKINLNTDTPAIRFGGVSVFDSGSNFGESGSLLWDSQENHWVYQHPASTGAPYSSAMLISGPKNSGSLGDEQGLTSGKISKAVGDDHIGDSIMTETNGGIGINGSLSVTGSATLSSSLTATNLYLGSLTNEQLMISGGGSRGVGVSTITSGDPFVRLYDNTTIKADIWWGRSGNYMGINSVGGATAINPNGGVVLIGTTSNNSARLQVNGDVTLGGSINSAWAVSVDNLGTTNANGLYVNIGASSTGVPFSVYKNFTSLFQIANSGASTFASSVTSNSGDFFATDGTRTNFFGVSTGQSAGMLGTTTNHDLKLITNNTSRLTISKSGAATFSGRVTATEGEFNYPGTTSLYLSNSTLSAGNSSGTTGLYMGDSGSGVNVLTREKVTQNTAYTSIYSEYGYNNAVKAVQFFNGSATFFGNVALPGSLSVGGTIKTFKVTNTFNENISNTNYFRVSSSGGGFQVIVYTLAQNPSVGWSQSQVFQAVTAPYWGGWIGTSGAISTIGSNAGFLSSAVVGNDGTITFRVSVGNNGTSTTSTVVSFIQVTAFNIDNISVTLL
jgi:hypothetical protein